VVEDAEVDEAEAVPCFRMDWGLAAGGVLPVCGALDASATIQTGSGGAAAERVAEAAAGRDGRLKHQWMCLELQRRREWQRPRRGGWLQLQRGKQTVSR